MKRATRILVGLCLCGLIAGTGLPARAQYTWSGADGVNNYWADADNWVEAGSPGYNSSAVFPDPAPAVKTADMNGVNRTGLHNLYFNTAGYVIGGAGSIRFDDDDTGDDDIRSMGAGINEIACAFEFAYVTATTEKVINIGAGNWLNFSGAFTTGAPGIIQGPGTMAISGPDATSRSSKFNFTIEDPAFTFLANSMVAVGYAQDWTQGTIGGTGGHLLYGNGVAEDFLGGTFAPGGDGVLGNEIGEFRFQAYDAAGSGSNPVNFTGIQVDMQIDSLGNHDKVVLELGGSGRLNINSDVTLNIIGTAIPDGSYVLFENVACADITGTFSTVNFNGSAANPSNFTVHHNGSDITLDVVGIPEPASLGLVAMAAALLAFRRNLHHRRK